MKKVKITDNPGLYTRMLIRLYELWVSIPHNSKKSYLSYKEVNEKLCRNFSISDTEVLNHLKFFEEFGYIEFVKFRGIKLKFEVVK